MKTLLCAFLILSSLLSPLVGSTAFADTSSTQVSVIATVCYIYSTPDFTSPIEDENGNQISLRHGDKLELIEENENDFYKVELNLTDQKIEGFVFKHYVTKNLNGQDVYPVFNGRVLFDNAVIYDVNKEETTFRANKNQEVFIHGGFNDKNEYTAIAIVLEDSSLFYGYMKTKDVNPYGVSAGLITSITIIAALVTIITSVVFIKKTKKKKAK